MIPAILMVLVVVPERARAQSPSAPPSDGTLASPPSQAASKPVAPPAASSRPDVQQEQPRPPALPSLSSTAAAVDPAPRLGSRFAMNLASAWSRGCTGSSTASRLWCRPTVNSGRRTCWSRPTSRSRPYTSGELQALLHENNGPFAEYQVLQTDHYLIFYSRHALCQDSRRLLEDLYHGLIDTFGRNKFRSTNPSSPWWPSSSRPRKTSEPTKESIHKSAPTTSISPTASSSSRSPSGRPIEPKVSALLNPQTVAHEGSPDPLEHRRAAAAQLVAALVDRGPGRILCDDRQYPKGIMWSGIAAINSLHMATIRELEDPLSNP